MRLHDLKNSYSRSTQYVTVKQVKRAEKEAKKSDDGKQEIVSVDEHLGARYMPLGMTGFG